MQILAIATAYAIKDELGGGFRAAAKDKRSGVVVKSDVLPTMTAARHQARVFAFDMLGEDFKNTKPGYQSDKTSWTCNYWG